MALQFRAPAVLVEDSGLLPGTHMVARNHFRSQVPEGSKPLLTSAGTRFARGSHAYTHAGGMLIHITYINL